MSENVTLTEEELKLLKNNNDEFNNLLSESGETAYQIRLLEHRTNLINARLDQLYNERLEAMQKLTEKYGEGEVDISTGIFISAKPE